VNSKRLVGIGEMIISDNPEDVLYSPSLGSCLGVALYDRQLKLGGLVHCLLPFSQADPEKARSNPSLYVDSGVSLLFEAFLQRGSDKRRIVVKAAGGAAINDSQGYFDIGNRNFTVLRKLLWKNNLLLTAADVGGGSSRTVSLHVGTGAYFVRKNGAEEELT
jgi:chemotaxis protein CheD